MKSKMKRLMHSLNVVRSAIVDEMCTLNELEAHVCDRDSDVSYVLDYENTQEMDSAVMMLIKEGIIYV